MYSLRTYYGFMELVTWLAKRLCEQIRCRSMWECCQPVKLTQCFAQSRKENFPWNRKFLYKTFQGKKKKKAVHKQGTPASTACPKPTSSSLPTWLHRHLYSLRICSLSTLSSSLVLYSGCRMFCFSHFLSASLLYQSIHHTLPTVS